jgi:hypothetical protein
MCDANYRRIVIIPLSSEHPAAQRAILHKVIPTIHPAVRGFHSMRTIVVLAVSLAILPSAADAAIKYTFRQVTRSEFQTMPSSELRGEAVIDNDQSRVDFKGRSFYGDNAYVISLDGSKRINSVAAALGTSKIDVANLKVETKKLPDRLMIAGLPTEHHRIEMSYDISMPISTLTLRQRVNTVIERWTTDAFGDVNETFLSSGAVRTGNPQLDQIIDAEAGKIKGLPLRQITTITTTSQMPKKQNVNSQLRLNPSRKQSTEMLVDTVQLISADPKLFAVPASYQRTNAGSPIENPIHELSLEPAGN